MRRRSWQAGAVVVSLASLLLAGCPDPDAAPSQAQPIRIGIAIPSYVHAVAWIGKEQGLFQAEGLEPTVQVMGGSAATMRALIADGIDVGLAGGDAVIKANRAGADLVVLAGLVDRFYHRLVVPADIKTADDLRGKTVGLAILGGPQEIAARYALKSLGLDPEQDVKLRSMGREFNRLAALSRGDVHATVSQTPPSRLKELGLHVLVDLPATDVRFPYAVVVARRKTVAAQPDRLRAFLRGLTRAVAYYKAPANKAACLAIIGKASSSSDTQAAAEARYETGGPGLLSAPPHHPSVEGFQTVLTFLKVTDVEPSSLFDLTLLGEAAGAKN